jgi:hypothetical protein
MGEPRSPGLRQLQGRQGQGARVGEARSVRGSFPSHADTQRFLGSDPDHLWVAMGLTAPPNRTEAYLHGGAGWMAFVSDESGNVDLWFVSDEEAEDGWIRSWRSLSYLLEAHHHSVIVPIAPSSTHTLIVFATATNGRSLMTSSSRCDIFTQNAYVGLGNRLDARFYVGKDKETVGTQHLGWARITLSRGER